jgi:hypothetical protein
MARLGRRAPSEPRGPANTSGKQMQKPPMSPNPFTLVDHHNNSTRVPHPRRSNLAGHARDPFQLFQSHPPEDLRIKHDRNLYDRGMPGQAYNIRRFDEVTELRDFAVNRCRGSARLCRDMGEWVAELWDACMEHGRVLIYCKRGANRSPVGAVCLAASVTGERCEEVRASIALNHGW